MKISIYYILFFLIGVGFLLSGCQTRVEEGIEEKITLSDAVPLSAVKKSVSVDLLRPSKLIVHGDKLVVYDMQEENMFKVFELPEVRYRYSFGNVGQGPDDFVFIDKESLNSGKQLEIVDQQELIRLDLTDTGAVRVSRHPLLFEERAVLSGVKRINDSIYLSDGFSDEKGKELQRMNIVTGDVEEFGEIPQWNKELSTFTEKKQAYSKSFCVNEQTGESAVFYYMYPKFRLFSKDNKCVKTVTIQTGSGETPTEEGRIFFTESFATPSHLYVMWVDKSKEEVMKDVETFQPDLLVFDWEGNLEARYRLDQPVITFTVAGNKLYAPSFLETDVLYEYELPALKIDRKKYHRLSSTYFSFDIYKSYHFATTDSIKLNGTGKRGDYIYGVVYMAQGDNRVYDDLEAMSVAGYSPLYPGVTLDDFMKYLRERKQVEPVSRVEPTPFEINGREVRPLELVYKSKDPRTGKEFLLYSYDFIFEIDGSFIIWGFSALQPILEKYRDDALYMISTVSLNRNPFIL